MPGPTPGGFADAELAAYVAGVRAEPGPSVRQLGVAAVRQAQRLRVLAGAPGPKLAAVEDLTAGLRQVPVRWYRPAAEPRPLVVFLHGGMWVIGDLDSHGRACRRLAARAGVEQWVPGQVTLADPRVSPLHAANLSGLPPAVVVTAEHDPLRDEGDAYAARLAAAGVPVLHRAEAGMIHGFLSMDRISPAAPAAGDRLFADVARLMGTGIASDPAARSGSAGRT